MVVLISEIYMFKVVLRNQKVEKLVSPASVRALIRSHFHNSRSELAARLGVHVATVWRWTQTGGPPWLAAYVQAHLRAERLQVENARLKLEIAALQGEAPAA